MSFINKENYFDYQFTNHSFGHYTKGQIQKNFL
jgi:hypothetical protein